MFVFGTVQYYIITHYNTQIKATAAPGFQLAPTIFTPAHEGMSQTYIEHFIKLNVPNSTTSHWPN